MSPIETKDKTVKEKIISGTILFKFKRMLSVDDKPLFIVNDTAGTYLSAILVHEMQNDSGYPGSERFRPDAGMIQPLKPRT